MDKETYTLLEDYMLSCMEDSAHDKEHIYRVLYNALEIAKTEHHVDYDILITSCLLHDIGRKEQFDNPSLSHALIGSQKAYAFLTEHGFDSRFAEEVKHCILAHSYRQKNPPQSLEAKILFDADKLDVVGAIGIARTLLYKGIVSEPIYSLMPDGSVSTGENDAAPSFFHEYKHKLEKMYSHFYTVRAAGLAKEREQIAVDFYNHLYQESTFSYRHGRKELDRLIQ